MDFSTYRNTTDPDSRVVRHDGGKALPCYKNHRVVDDKAGMVAAIKTTHGVANEAAEMMGMLDQHKERTRRGVCAACPLRSQYTRDKSGRTLKRHLHQELLDQARNQSHSEAAREDRKRRQWFQERNFGEAATMHRFK